MSQLSLDLTDNAQVSKVAKFFRFGNRWAEPKSDAVVEPKPAPVQAASADDIPWLERNLRSHYYIGLAAFALTLAIVVGWAGIMPLAGAVVVGGTFVVHSNTKRIQHRMGGVVKTIAVHDGSKVKAGDLLVELDATDARAETLAIARQIDETQFRIARLTAERDGAAVITAPNKFLLPVEDRQNIEKSEIDFFKARQQSQRNIQRLANNRITQLEKQISGLRAQLQTNKRQEGITGIELAGMEELRRKKIAPIQRLTPLQREMARLEGGDIVIQSTEQETIDKISETKLQVQQSEQTFRADVLHDLTDASGKVGQLIERLIVSNQALDRTRIVAPVAGVVNEMSVHTVGGVVSPAETLMMIVPEDDRLEVAVRLSPDKIDQVRKEQRARVKLTAFERTTPDIEGSVSSISPDLVETKSGSYYDVRIAVDQQPRLAPGMPAEVFIKTQDRTMLSYLAKPLTENLSRMFVER